MPSPSASPMPPSTSSLFPNSSDEPPRSPATISPSSTSKIQLHSASSSPESYPPPIEIPSSASRRNPSPVNAPSTVRRPLLHHFRPSTTTPSSSLRRKPLLSSIPFFDPHHTTATTSGKVPICHRPSPLHLWQAVPHVRHLLRAPTRLDLQRAALLSTSPCHLDRHHPRQAEPRHHSTLVSAPVRTAPSLSIRRVLNHQPQPHLRALRPSSPVLIPNRQGPIFRLPPRIRRDPSQDFPAPVPPAHAASIHEAFMVVPCHPPML